MSLKRALAILLTVLALACGAERRPEQVVVDEVELEGVKRFEKDELLAHTYLTEYSIWFWGDDGVYSEALSRLDRPLVRELYHAYGFHAVEVAPIEIDADDDVEEAVVRLAVTEGPPTLVEGVDFAWPDGEPRYARDVEKRATLKVGQPFEIPAFNDTANRMRVALQEEGHALAEVSKAGHVDREARVARASYTLKPGPVCFVGAIRFQGLEGVKEEVLRREIRFAPGEKITPTLLKRIEKQIYAGEMFRSVVVTPADAAGAEGALDLTIHVDEIDPQWVELGGGLGFEPTRWVQRGIVRYGHDNLFGRLVRFDVKLTAGYAELPVPWAPDSHGPVASLEPRLRFKGFLEDELQWTLAPGIELGIEEGYQFYSPSGRIGVSRFFFGRTLAELAYSVEFFDFFNVDRAITSNRNVLGLDFQDPYLLSRIELTYTIAFTDDFFRPTEGVEFELRYGLAGGIFGGDFDFQEFGPAVRGFLPLPGPFQLAARARTGMILPYGDQPGAPISLKYALGGADTIRGWGLKRLSPQVRTCEDCRGIPVGGNTHVLGNLELRWNAVGELYLVLFGDAADVQPEELTWKPDDWQYSSGFGIRYDSPIGMIRLDVGFRITEDEERFPDEPFWALHLALGEPF